MRLNGYKQHAGPDGLHVFNRTTGINILFNEIRFKKENWNISPKNVSIALTDKCDLKCHFCYAPKSSSELDFEVLKSWILELDANGCLGVGFGGGEPLLYNHFDELIEFVSNHTRLATTITTHGHLFSDDRIDKLTGKINFARFSMDGVGETYEKIRMRKFNNLIKVLEDVSGKIKFGINYVVNRETVNDLDDAYKIALELGAEEFLLLPEIETSRNSGFREKEKDLLKAWVAEKGNEKIRMAISLNSSEGFPVCGISENEIDGSHFYLHIDSKGFLKRASFVSLGVEIAGEGIIKSINRLRENY